MTSILSQPQLWSFPFCPTPPSWELDWEAIQNHFDCIQRLQGCPQNPLYHAEGDVLTHTRMVCEAMVSSPNWQQLSAEERSILFAAALLHDIAKPVSTTIDDQGQISSHGHVRQGVRMVREVLWQLDEPVPFHIRENIVSLVQLGSLPIWFWEKPNPQKSVIRASQVVRCDWLAMLAEADVRGRECADQLELLQRIDLFREFCQENDCLDHPRRFPSPHSRFIYFHKEDAYPDYQAFDDTQCEVILMSGLPGSGKDTWIRENYPELPVISLDALRQEMNIAPDETPGILVKEAKERAREYLRSGTCFVWNATNITRPMRQQLIKFFSDYKARICIVYLEVGLEELLQRNQERKAGVPAQVIYKLASRLDVPDITEAQAVEWINSSAFK